MIMEKSVKICVPIEGSVVRPVIVNDLNVDFTVVIWFILNRKVDSFAILWRVVENVTGSV